jgi:cytochrome c553
MVPHLYWLLLPASLAGAAAQAAGDPVAGKDKAQLCMGCHGVDGYSRDETIPHLYSQPAAFVVAEMLEFQTGRRSDPVMAPLAQTVTRHEDLEDIAAYFASLPKRQITPATDALARRGRQLFISERCVFCHGEVNDVAAPYIAGAPLLAGQHKAYLLKTIREIRDGKRRGDEYNLMQPAFKRLSEADIEAIAHYLAGL